MAVYGWMPTILDNMGYTEENNKEWEKKICLSVKNIIDNDGDLDNCSDDFDNLKTFVNNSYVGLSKFLHFLLPDKFAIWDSNVYIALLGWQNGVLNKILNLEQNADAKDGVIEDIIKTYSGSVYAHTNNKDNFLEYEKLIINYAKDNQINPRDVEKHLFCFGKWLHNLANSLKNVESAKEYKKFINKPENETKAVEELKETYEIMQITKMLSYFARNDQKNTECLIR